MEQRSQWGTRLGFLLAAMGSAIGLGNIWRFPATAYANGGGAFFIPYLFALITAGIPLLILEYTIGHKYRSSAPRAFRKFNKKSEWIGWWQVGISFVINTYYPIIVAWALMYTYFSFTEAWGSDSEAFFVGDFLNASAPGEFGSIVPNVLLPLGIVWLIVFAILFRGVKKGIEVANKIFIPLLMVSFLLIVIRALTLPGAAEGLNTFFEPNWDKIFDGSVWIAAYGQIFYSLSIAFAIMITFSSYLPKDSDITNNAFITGFANSSFELLAGIGVFSALGFMAAQSGQEVSEVVRGGIGLAFMVFPEIISQMPASSFFGVLFFGSLVLAGLSSMVSISETYIAALQEKFSIKRHTAVFVGVGLSAVISVVYTNQSGLFLLDTVDYFVNNYGVALVGLVEVVVIAWFLRQLKPLREHANNVSDIHVGKWWSFSLGVITPVVLGFMMVQNFRTDFTENYEGYPTAFLISYGWIVAAALIAIGFIFTLKKWPKEEVK
ncbi:NSS family neurotransmitter:Na+ symporter [Streptohalobacillus salinus]|uniref:NSS family neurotransmitter:Na+ symporter n=1 Tax=Streptohalobacillus salinus TaxID=621096 RepID=A0A2V3WAI0_9BACI|nr:sodium-dependent transporter [Streptohalobacillus salinus]PXW91403.1 NSS family neurotransmitter:Na+ symporter [Streptohalobacillus salinus]